MARRCTAASSEQISYGDIAALSGLSALTLSCWMKAASIAAGQNGAQLFTKSQSTPSILGWGIEQYVAVTNASAFALICRNTLDTYGLSGDGLITTSAWLHVVYRYDGAGAANADKLKLYTDGTERTLSYSPDAIPASIGASSDAVLIGKGPGAVFYDGELADVAAWTRALTVDEITALSQKRSPFFFRQNLAFYTRLVREATDHYGAVATLTGTTVTDHPPMRYVRPESVWAA